LKRDSGRILVLSAYAAAIIFAVFISPICAGASNLGQFFFPLSFPGPYSGTVVDSEGNPIPGAIVEVQWMLHDNPLPDGVGHYPIKAAGETDKNGIFYIKKQESRGGLSQTDLSIKITAKGYIERVLIIYPKGNLVLPQQTIDWPFADTSIHKSPPEPFNVRLKPALPVILKAIQSKDPLIKWKAEQELRKLKNNQVVKP